MRPVSLWCPHSSKYIRAGVGPHSHLAAVSDAVSAWESFVLDDFGASSVTVQSLWSERFVRAGVGPDSHLAAVSSHIGGWETFKLIELGGGKSALQSTHSGKYVRAGVGPDSHLAAVSDHIDAWETFELRDSAWRPDFRHPDAHMTGIRTVRGSKPVLTVLVDYPDQPISDHNVASADGVGAYTANSFTTMLFGPRPSVRDWFEQNSYGAFTITNAGVVGWLRDNRAFGDRVNPAPGTYRATNQYRVARTRAVQLADAQVNFAQFDTDGDGVVTPEDLSIIVVYSHGEHWTVPGGLVRPINAFTTADGVYLGDHKSASLFKGVAEMYLHAPMSKYIHELCHLLLHLEDLYADVPAGIVGRASDYSIMDDDWNYRHLDPWSKMNVGWVRPRVIFGSEAVTLRAIEEHGDVALLYEPAHGRQEFFLVENRWPGTSYDAGIPGGIPTLVPGPAQNETTSAGIADAGLAVWHVDHGSKWQDDNTNGRRALRLVTRDGSWPIASATALWDASEPGAGYDLTTSSSPADTCWADGSTNAIRVANIPSAGPVVTVTVSNEG